MDRQVCPLISVLCSLEIVKRVVTVKQVRPSFAGDAPGVRSGLGMGMCCRCVPAPAGAVFAHRLQAVRSGSGRRLVCDHCRLTTDHGARVWGWARARHEKGIWWMPWHREAMKDVARCEKPRGGASAR